MKNKVKTRWDVRKYSMALNPTLAAGIVAVAHRKRPGPMSAPELTMPICVRSKESRLDQRHVEQHARDTEDCYDDAIDEAHWQWEDAKRGESDSLVGVRIIRIHVCPPPRALPLSAASSTRSSSHSASALLAQARDALIDVAQIVLPQRASRTVEPRDRVDDAYSLGVTPFC